MFASLLKCVYTKRKEFICFVTSRLIWIYTICNSVFDFRLKPYLHYWIQIHGRNSPLLKLRCEMNKVKSVILILFSCTGLVLWYFCTFFREKLTTALLESAEGREWPKKIVHGPNPRPPGHRARIRSSHRGRRVLNKLPSFSLWMRIAKSWQTV